jgi:stage V sporulation protein B
LQKFMYGALLLMTASFITRILGFFYKVYTIRLIGPEGIGLYEMVFPVYSLFLVMTTAGIPVAVSKLISESYAQRNTNNVRRIFYVSIFFLIVSGLLSTIIIIWLAPYLATKIFSDTRVYWPFIATIPAIFIVAVGSVFRGYFQGIQNMLPNSLSQIFETVIRFIVGIYLATYLLNYGLEFSAAGLAIAMVSGEIVGLVVLILFFKNSKEISEPSCGVSYSITRTLKEIYVLALPITLTRVVVSFSSTLHAVLIPKGLSLAGYSVKEATQIYGQFSGMAFSLINLPTIITVSLAISLVPAIAEAAARRNYILIKKRTNQAFRITIITAIPVAIVFINLSEQLMGLFYNSSEAGVILKVLALGCPFFYLQHTTGGLLQGLGRVEVIFKNALFSTLIDTGLIYWLTPHFGIYGSIFAVITGSIYYSLANLKWLFNFCRLRLDWPNNIIKPLFAGVIMSITLKILIRYSFIAVTWYSIISILLLSLLIYILSLSLLGTISLKELLSITKIRSIK